MSFITVMIYINPKLSMPINDLLYLYLISTSFIFLYIFIEYYFIKKHFIALKSSCRDGYLIQEELQTPKTLEQQLFQQILKQVDQQHQQKVTSILNDKKETMDYMTSWFHEIKTPISVSRLIIENEKKNPVLNSIEEEVDTIEGYVEQALYFIRADDFNQDYFIVPVDLGVVIRLIIKQNAKIFIRKKIKLKLEVESTEVLTDQKWLVYILAQILSNALKYTSPQGEVNISTEEDDIERRLIIEDNGIGIDQADIQRVFDKGFTGMNGRSHGNSTGMGLYLAKRLANKLGHSITITSEKNLFTVVTIHFPKLHDYYAIT
ncbi:sensor histidine kinase [Viridibacillus arvi]|uniref:sensor histidine kinase n=2 Tax=Viridibacillus TaxID=496496 RepID=UPI00187BC4B2|nr:sensor histidine kinase [Viridibacillus sp. JNUCC-6]QOV12330.1 sensor histidine kinase [Viridibacillus sp. JNUCC-6]